MNVCTFTGHRPNKLGGYNYDSYKNIKIKNIIQKEVEALINKKDINTFIVGGALGFDQMAFQVLFSLKNKYEIIIKVAIPFEQQDSNWPQSSKNFYRNQLKLADELIYVDKLENYKIKNIQEDIYHITKMQKRNEYMVDNADYLIACHDGTNGGTKNCIDYWIKMKKENSPIIINPKNLTNLNLQKQFYKDIPLKLINRNYENYKAKRFVINDTNQNIWIPNIYLEPDGTLKKNINLDFIFDKQETKNKLKLAGL